MCYLSREQINKKLTLIFKTVETCWRIYILISILNCYTVYHVFELKLSQIVEYPFLGLSLLDFHMCLDCMLHVVGNANIAHTEVTDVFYFNVDMYKKGHCYIDIDNSNNVSLNQAVSQNELISMVYSQSTSIIL